MPFHERYLKEADLVRLWSAIRAEDPERIRELKGFGELMKQGFRFLLVDTIRGLRVKIWSDEHPPPHFHVEYQGESASFSIINCERLPNTFGLERYEKSIRKWWKENQSLLVKTWNETRPFGCPVGPIREQPFLVKAAIKLTRKQAEPPKYRIISYS